MDLSKIRAPKLKRAAVRVRSEAERRQILAQWRLEDAVRDLNARLNYLAKHVVEYRGATDTGLQTARREAALFKLRSATRAAQAERDAAIATLNQDRDEKIAAANAALKNRIAAIERQFEESRDKAIAPINSELDDIQDISDPRVDELMAARRDLYAAHGALCGKRIYEVHASHRKQLAEIRKMHNAAVAAVREKCTAAEHDAHAKYQRLLGRWADEAAAEQRQREARIAELVRRCEQLARERK